MELKTINLEIKDNTALVTINRPKAMNALNKEVFDELDYLFDKHLLSLDINGVIITGAGERAFVAGADITEFPSLDVPGGMALSKRGMDVFDRIESFPKPVIAVVNGFALGGGCELSMACHMRIATENAKFGQPEANLGLTPGYGGTQRLTRYLGKAKSLELLMSCDMISGQEAVDLGLANYVFSDKTAAMLKAESMMKKFGKKAPIALARIITCVNDYYDKDKNGFQSEIDSFGETMNSTDCKEGVNAFLEKRKPNFIGK